MSDLMNSIVKKLPVKKGWKKPELKESAFFGSYIKVSRVVGDNVYQIIIREEWSKFVINRFSNRERNFHANFYKGEGKALEMLLGIYKVL